jgi:AcrR family transcriptional regulator
MAGEFDAAVTQDASGALSRDPSEVASGPASDAARDPRAVRTRERVLAATVELVGEVGFGRVTMGAVAARARVARSTLYRHWADLPELLDDALRTHVLRSLDPDSGDLRLDLLTLLRAAAGFLGDRDLRSTFLAMLAEAQRDPALAEVHARAERTRRARFLEVLERARDRGELAAEVDVEVLLDDLVAPVFHRVMMRGLELDEAFLAWHVQRTLARHDT